MNADLAEWLTEQVREDMRLVTERTEDGLTLDDSWHTRQCGYYQGEHMVPCDCAVPERVLHDCATKQQVVAIHIRQDNGPDQADSCWTCEGEDWPCPTLRLLALPYADRPGFREEWRP